MPEPKRPLKVFLCHAHSDKDAVKVLYTRLATLAPGAHLPDLLNKSRAVPGSAGEDGVDA